MRPLRAAAADVDLSSLGLADPTRPVPIGVNGGQRVGAAELLTAAALVFRRARLIDAQTTSIGPASRRHIRQRWQHRPA